MKDAIAGLLGSKKFVSFVTGVVGILLARWGLELDEATVAAMFGVLAVLLGAQGAADHGKEAAKIAATTTTTTVATVQPPNTEVVTSTTVPQ